MRAAGAVVVGTGFGCRVHVPALRAAGLDVVALVGRDPDRTARRAARLGVEHACTSLDEALARAGADVVTIATPPATHAPLAHAALAAGRHVLCEKPFALDATEAATMLAAARAAGVVHLVGHEFRFAADRAAVAAALARGAIGAPRLVTMVQHVSLAADPEARVPAWWFDPDAGGGWLGASGSHAVDQVRSWLGEVASLSAVLPSVVERPRAGRRGRPAAEDSFTVRFRLVNGAEGVLQQTAAAWGMPLVATLVAGSAGTVGIDADGAWLADHDGRRRLDPPPGLDAPDPSPSDDPRERYTHLELGPYTRLCEVLRARVEGREPPYGEIAPATFADGVACMQVLDAVRASAARGGEVVAPGGDAP